MWFSCSDCQLNEASRSTEMWYSEQLKGGRDEKDCKVAQKIDVGVGKRRGEVYEY